MSKLSSARLPLICCADGSCEPKNEAKTRKHTGCDFSADLSEKLFSVTQPASRCLWISLNTEMFCTALTFNLCCSGASAAKSADIIDLCVTCKLGTASGRPTEKGSFSYGVSSAQCRRFSAVRVFSRIPSFSSSSTSFFSFCYCLGVPVIADKHL